MNERNIYLTEIENQIEQIAKENEEKTSPSDPYCDPLIF